MGVATSQVLSTCKVGDYCLSTHVIIANIASLHCITSFIVQKMHVLELQIPYPHIN